MDLHTPRFTTRQTALAAGFEPSSFRNFLSRGQLALPTADDADLAEGKGRANLFNLRMVYQAAVANRLIKAGVEPSRSFVAAADFAHTGTADRLPGHLFPNGATILVCLPGPNSTRLVNTHDLRNVELGQLFGGGNGVCVAVLVNEVLRDVNNRLLAETE